MGLLFSRLMRAFSLTKDLVQSLSPEELRLHLVGLPSNSIGHQLWCVIGARESYFKAIVNSGWSGFDCSLKDTTSMNMVLAGLEDSAAKCLRYLEGRDLSPIQSEYLVDLLEHEVQHHGQLIRYIYANKLTFPQSWKDRYHV